MTRKDYVNIAAAILATQTRIRAEFERKHESKLHQRGLVDIQRDNQLRGVRRAAAHLCDFLAEDNPHHFDKGRFLTNCGYGATTMNPSDPALDLRPLPGETVTVRGEERPLAEFDRS